MNQWHYNDSGQQRGPVSGEELRSMLESRSIPGNTLVWTEGMGEWKPADSIEGFQLSPYAPPAASPDPEVDWSGYEPSGSQSRPWVRYWARTFDFLLFAMVVGLVAVAIIPEAMEMNDTLLGIILLVGYNFVEPVMLATFGATPFKALLRIRVRNNDGTKPSYLRGLSRTFSLWIRGQGMGIPLFALIAGIMAHNRLSKEGITTWDQSGGFTVSHQTIAWWRWLLLVGLFAGFFGLMILGAEA